MIIIWQKILSDPIWEAIASPSSVYVIIFEGEG